METKDELTESEELDEKSGAQPEKNPLNAKKIALFVVYGLVAAFAACDAGCKAANVTVETFDKNKPGNADKLEVPLIVLIKFRGSVENVTAAVEAAEAEANRLTGVVSKHIIANVTEGADKMMKLNAFDKK